ncbi:hypothetical protein [Terrarubrum flagellatum]|uniref:hypothetical protein n=1 Tax=Terrirubrum flagellatum TaxID=2895980 RepID=UPI0031453C7B
MLSEPRFWDRSKRRAWDRAIRFTDRVAAHPSSIRQVVEWINAHWAGDPAAAESLRLWRGVLTNDPQQIAKLVLADDDRGEFLRDTIPPIFPIGAAERAEMLRARQ